MRTRFLLPGLIVVVMGFCGCDKTSELDITDFRWKLHFMKTDHRIYKPNEQDFSCVLPFVLIFWNDSSSQLSPRFQLCTSSNLAGGEYNIPERGRIDLTYGVFTAVESIDEFDDKFVAVFKEVTSYTVEGNTLIFKGAKGEAVFKQE